MFGSIDKSKGLLFVTYDLEAGLRNTIAVARKEVEEMDANRFLNTSPADLKRFLVEKHGVEPLKLLRDQWNVESQDVQVDVRYDPMRWIDDTSRPVMIPGERIELHVPFSGDSELFYSRANTFSMNPPRAVIHNNELLLRFESPADQPRDFRAMIDQALATIEQHIEWQRGLVETHSSTLSQAVEQAIQQRRERLLAQSQRVEALGIPVRRRLDAPTTYAIPAVRRRATPTLPPATTAQFQPEPTWEMAQYEQALKIVQDMSLVMERSPEAFKSLDEEALRQNFLMQLNGQFEGNATGETFNMSGKTDILLRVGDRNVFIAECKFWKGPKAFGEAVDQLMGYSTWRDSKTAILVFNRGTDMSTVLSGIDTTMKAHKNFKRAVNWPHESGFRYTFGSTGDLNREMTVTVLVFHVPK